MPGTLRSGAAEPVVQTLQVIDREIERFRLLFHFFNFDHTHVHLFTFFLSQQLKRVIYLLFRIIAYRGMNAFITYVCYPSRNRVDFDFARFTGESNQFGTVGTRGKLVLFIFF